MDVQSPYEILDLPVNAPLDVVKRQYKLMIRKYPPEQDPDAFNNIRRAYDQINSELFAPKQAFPRYKKAMENQIETPSVNNLNIIQQVFETPFNTHFELEKLLEDIEI